jgi:divalent metal cation (Fe/Co/Zn/Cd) transporter
MVSEVVSRSQRLRHAVTLEYVTVGWNVMEGLLAIICGSINGSIALIGFGIDSFVETSSGAILIWRLHAERRGRNADQAERKALKLVGASFVLLAAYVAIGSIRSLAEREAPERSIIGVAIAVMSLVVMPWLAYQKRKVAGALNSAALHADSRQTSLCAYLSAILLAGLLLNVALHWWWADPVAALFMVPIIAGEGRDALRGKSCSNCR